jgi:5'(3')-deoxyribonucleotidase
MSDDRRKPVVLGVDLDGVCADFYGHMRVLTAEWFERPLEEIPEHVSYGLPEWGVTPQTYPSLHRWAVSGRNLFREVPMIPGARRVLRRMSNEGYHIRIITHRLFIAYFHAMAVQQTIEWLDHYGIPYSDLGFMKEKDQVGADIYVEDNPNALQDLRNAGLRAICFANSTNVGIGPPRATNWDEVYTLVHQIEPPE